MISKTSGPTAMRLSTFPLEESLPAVCAVALNKLLCALLYLDAPQERAWPLTKHQYTTSEITFLFPILEQYPHHSPYEMLG